MGAEVIVYVAASLDGFIARSDGSIDWLDVAGPVEAEQSMSDFLKLLDSVDCLVMGRKTFDTVKGFSPWPYGALPVIVLSSTLSSPPEIEGATISIRAGRPSDVLRDLQSDGFERVYVDGGATIHGFLREDLVDRITVATVPVLLGSGRPLFPQMDHELKLRLESSVRFDSGIVKSTYVCAREA